MERDDVLANGAANTFSANEEPFRLLVEGIKDYAIFIVDTNGYIMSWNKGVEQIKGYTAEEIIGKHISVFYTTEEIQDNEPAKNLMAAAEKGSFEREGWRVRKDGSRFWANVIFTAFYNNRHELIGFAKVTRDITEKKKAEEQIAYMARLMEDTNDAIISTDTDYVVKSWNRAAEVLYGFSAEEARERPMNDIIKSQMPEETRIQIRNELVREGYWKGEVSHVTKGGKEIFVLISISATKDVSGEKDGYVMSCRDITERKKAENQLRAFNDELEKQVRQKTAELTGIFERITDAFIAVDKNFCYTYLNKKAGEMIHHEPSSLIGKNVWDVFPDAIGSATYNAFIAAMRDQQYTVNTDYYPPLNLWQENHLYPSPDGLSIFIRDITESKNAEEKLRQSHEDLRQLASHLQDIREEERADIAREIHDELGQRLTGLKMDMFWMAKKLEQPGQESILREKVNETIKLLDGTVKTVRKLATELRPSILDDLGLIAAIEWQSQEFESRSGINAQFESGVDGLNFSSNNAIGLFRICQESLTNVGRHSGAKNVLISLQQDEKKNVLLTIQDDGKGFNMTQHGHKKTLGLLGMKERTLMMGGKFDLFSEPGKGTTLVVTIPLANISS